MYKRQSLCFAAIVPDYKLLTEAARAALPKEVTHKDAVYNLSRAALIPAAFCEGRHDLLAIATEDKLHQPYRMPLMPGSKEVFDMARLCGAKAVYVSGAGSTVMAVAEKANAEKFYSKLEKGLELLEGLDGCEAFTRCGWMPTTPVRQWNDKQDRKCKTASARCTPHTLREQKEESDKIWR